MTHSAIRLTSIGRQVAPVAQTPVFVIDKYTPICHRGHLPVIIAVGQREPASVFWCGITPPYPWRNARQARQFQYAVGRASAIVALYNNVSVVGTDAEGIRFTGSRLINLDDCISGAYGISPCYGPHVLPKELKSLLDNGRYASAHVNGDGMLAIKPCYSRAGWLAG